MDREYLALQKATSDTIDRTGKPMLLRREEETRTPGGSAGETIITEQLVMVVETAFEHHMLLNGVIGVNDTRLQLSPYKLRPELVTLWPLEEYTLTDEHEKLWNFTHVKRISPGRIVLLFDIQAS